MGPSGQIAKGSWTALYEFGFSVFAVCSSQRCLRASKPRFESAGRRNPKTTSQRHNSFCFRILNSYRYCQRIACMNRFSKFLLLCFLSTIIWSCGACSGAGGNGGKGGGGNNQNPTTPVVTVTPASGSITMAQSLGV